MSDDLSMPQIFQSYSFWSIYKVSLIDSEKESFWTPTSQSVHAFDYYSTTNEKRSYFLYVIFNQGLCIIV